jgi:release factor glutamine methyltransferase
MQTQTTGLEPKWTILNLLKWTTDYFKSREIESPRPDAEVLLAEALQIGRIDLYVHYDQPLTTLELSLYKSMIKRRVQREPVAYIVGAKEFWSMDLCVSGDVLVPRPETECLVEKALSLIPEDVDIKILEIGTGSGAIALALASERPRCRIIASDLSIKALGTACKNADIHGLSERIHFLCGSGGRPLKESGRPFDLILSNPPYIRTDEIDGLQPEIVRYEPRMALDGGSDGLDCIREIICSAHRLLKPMGRLLLEIGYDQGPGVDKIAETVGCYETVAIEKDYSGHDRVVLIRKKEYK